MNILHIFEILIFLSFHNFKKDRKPDWFVFYFLRLESYKTKIKTFECVIDSFKPFSRISPSYRYSLSYCLDSKGTKSICSYVSHVQSYRRAHTTPIVCTYVRTMKSKGQLRIDRYLNACSRPDWSLGFKSSIRLIYYPKYNLW